ncbi:hypothetical protein D3C81_1425650 [compost metagenome]
MHQRRGQTVLGDGRHCNGVGRRQHRRQGEGHRQRDAWQQPVNEVSGADHGKQHQPHRQRDHRPANAPKFALGNTPAIGEQQRWQEQEEEQLRVQGHVQPQGRPGQQRTGGDLHQWQGQRDHPPDQLRHADQREQNEDGIG